MTSTLPNEASEWIGTKGVTTLANFLVLLKVYSVELNG